MFVFYQTDLSPGRFNRLFRSVPFLVLLFASLFIYSKLSRADANRFDDGGRHFRSEVAVVGGDHNFPPFEFLDEDGEPAGFAVDLTRAIADAMDMDVEIRLGPWTEMRQALAGGEIDVLQGMLYSPERDLEFDFSTTYSVVHYIPVVRSGGASLPTSVKDLEGMDVAVQRDDIMHDLLRENEVDGKTGLYYSQMEAVKALKNGEHDCALVARQTANYLIRKHDWKNLNLGKTPFTSLEYSYAVPNNKEELQGYFNEGLSVLKESGDYRRIRDKWLSPYEESDTSLEKVLSYIAMVLIPLAFLFLLALLWIWSLHRKVAERTRELEESVEYQRAMIACSPMALFTIDLDGKVLTWNKSAERLFGWQAEEVIGKFLPFIPEDKQDEFTELRCLVSRGEGFIGKELIRKHKDGRLFPISLSTAPIYDRNREIIGILSIAQNITERKRAEEELKKSERKFRELFNNANDAMYLHTLRDDNSPGPFLEVNRVACEMLGYSREEFRQLTPLDIDAEEKRKQMPETITTLLQTGDATLETEHLAKDGSRIPVEINAHLFQMGEEVWVLAVARDIRQRLQRQSRILRLNSLLKAIRNVNQIIVMENDLQRLMEKVCQSLVETRSYYGSTVAVLDDDSGEIHPIATAGQPLFSADWRITPGGKGEAPECVKEAVKTREVVVRRPGEDCAECCVFGRGERYNIMAVVPMEADNEIVGLINIHVEAGVEIDREEQELLTEVAQDIAFARSKIVSEEKLRQARQQVIDQERHRALSIMASGIAHDFNNSLSTILGFTDLMLQSGDNLGNEKTLKNYLELIRKAASNAAETVRRMRKFYRPPEQENLTPLDLNSIIEEAVSMTQPRWKEQARARGADINIEKKLGEIETINGNEAELHEMLVNLIFNAVDAMPEGGILRVKTEQTGKQIILQISDTGTGMTEDVRQHCLEPFFTVNKGGKGTGLGLSTVQGTVERHHGDIKLLSEPGKGTTFRITFPVTAVEEAKPGEETETKKVSGLTILVVEDEPDQRQLLHDYLAMDQHTVETAADGREGLQSFLDGYYDLVIMDRSMPEIPGDELATQIKERAPGKPVIMLTGFGDMIEVSEEKPENVDIVLSKPVTLKQLRNAMSRMIM